MALYAMFLVLFTVPPYWAETKNSTEVPKFLFDYLQYDARFVSFIGIYCPPAVSINAHFLPASCQVAFLELLCICISPTLFFSHHYL